MGNKKDEQVIYLKDLLFAALYRWKSVLAWMLILGVLLGGFKGISSYLDMKDAEIQGENSAQQELAMEVYEAKKTALDQQIAVNRENARHQQVYLNESVLMNLDPYNFYEIYLSVFVDSGFQILPEMSYQNPDLTVALINGYREVISGQVCAQALAESMDTEAQYIKEIVTTEAPPDTRMLVVHAKAPDKVSAEQLLDLLLQQVRAAQADIAQTVGQHEIRVSEQFIREQLDVTLAALQQEQMDELTKLNNSLITLQTEKNELVPPKTLVASGSSVIKDAAIFAAVGAVLGVLLTVLAVWIGHIASGKVYSARTLWARTGVKVLGCVDTMDKRNSVDRWLRCAEGRNTAPVGQQTQLVAVNVRNLCSAGMHILVTGDAGSECRATLVEALRRAMPGSQVTDCGSLLQDVAAMEALTGADAVLLVEQCRVSCYAHVEQEMALVNDHSKQLIGCVLLDG